MSRSTVSPMDWNRTTYSKALSADGTGSKLVVCEEKSPIVKTENSHQQDTVTPPLASFLTGRILPLGKIYSSFFCFLYEVINIRNISIFPYILIGYLRLLFHLSWLGTLLWSLWSIYSILMNDISIKINNETNLILQEIEKAKILFAENKCFNYEIIRNSPALASLCNEWKATAEQSDPRSKISQGRLLAETIAEILNAFVERISFRSMIFTTIASIMFVFLSRSLCNFISPSTPRQCTTCYTHHYGHDASLTVRTPQHAITHDTAGGALVN